MPLITQTLRRHSRALRAGTLRNSAPTPSVTKRLLRAPKQGPWTSNQGTPKLHGFDRPVAGKLPSISMDSLVESKSRWIFTQDLHPEFENNILGGAFLAFFRSFREETNHHLFEFIKSRATSHRDLRQLQTSGWLTTRQNWHTPFVGDVPKVDRSGIKYPSKLMIFNPKKSAKTARKKRCSYQNLGYKPFFGFKNESWKMHLFGNITSWICTGQSCGPNCFTITMQCSAIAPTSSQGEKVSPIIDDFQ